MASEVEIANRALSKLGASPIISFGDDSRNARAVSRAYAIVRDAELAAHPWNFAKTHVRLAKDLTAPLFDFKNAFTLPSDCLRILPPNDYYVDWQERAGKIYTNWSDPLDLTYIRRETDTAKFPPVFVAALAEKLAMEICYEITESNSLDEKLAQRYERVIRNARRVNAFANPSDPRVEDAWVLIRA